LSDIGETKIVAVIMLNYNMGCGTSSNSSRTGTPEYHKAANIEIMQIDGMYPGPKDIIKRVSKIQHYFWGCGKDLLEYFFVLQFNFIG
jgi:hypothetical protein